MNKEEIQKAIQEANEPELANQSGMVYQLWEDGEITLQKSGPLLWQRNLHCIKSGFHYARASNHLLELFPSDNEFNGHRFIFTNELKARELREELFKYAATC